MQFFEAADASWVLEIELFHSYNEDPAHESLFAGQEHPVVSNAFNGRCITYCNSKEKENACDPQHFGLLLRVPVEHNVQQWVICQLKTNWGTWIRTMIHSSKGCCPTIRRSPNVFLLQTKHRALIVAKVGRL